MIRNCTPRCMVCLSTLLTICWICSGCSGAGPTPQTSETTSGRLAVAYDVYQILKDEWWRNSKFPTRFADIEERYRSGNSLLRSKLVGSATVRWQLSSPPLSPKLPHQRRRLKVLVTSDSGKTSWDDFEFEAFTKEAAHVHLTPNQELDPDPGNLANLYAEGLRNHPEDKTNLRALQGLMRANPKYAQFVELGGFERFQVLQWEHEIRILDSATGVCYVYPAWPTEANMYSRKTVTIKR